MPHYQAWEEFTRAAEKLYLADPMKVGPGPGREAPRAGGRNRRTDRPPPPVVGPGRCGFGVNAGGGGLVAPGVSLRVLWLPQEAGGSPEPRRAALAGWRSQLRSRAVRPPGEDARPSRAAEPAAASGRERRAVGGAT